MPGTQRVEDRSPPPLGVGRPAALSTPELAPRRSAAASPSRAAPRLFPTTSTIPPQAAVGLDPSPAGRGPSCLVLSGLAPAAEQEGKGWAELIDLLRFFLGGGYFLTPFQVCLLRPGWVLGERGRKTHTFLVVFFCVFFFILVKFVGFLCVLLRLFCVFSPSVFRFSLENFLDNEKFLVIPPIFPRDRRSCQFFVMFAFFGQTDCQFLCKMRKFADNSSKSLPTESDIPEELLKDLTCNF